MLWQTNIFMQMGKKMHQGWQIRRPRHMLQEFLEVTLLNVLHDVRKRSHLEVDIQINRFLCFEARSAKSGFSHYLFICWEFHAFVKSSRSFIFRQSLQNTLFISNIL